MTTLPDHDEVRAKLAAIEHERWSDWQVWCHKILRENCPSPELEKVLERWDRQIATPYDQLSDSEKASDMEQVDRYWPIILDLIAAEVAKGELYGRLHENIEQFQAGAISAQYYSDRHQAITGSLQALKRTGAAE